jgi:hypothetical protein
MDSGWRLKLVGIMVLAYICVVGYMFGTIPESPVVSTVKGDVVAFEGRVPASAGVVADERTVSSLVGTSTTVSSSVPVSEPAAVSSVAEKDTAVSVNVSVGSMHRCWVDAGRPVCVGQEHHGELGAGVVVPEIVDVQAGDGRTCALDVNGDVWCWGWKMSGGASYDAISDSYGAVKVNLPGKVTTMGVGLGQECAAVSVDGGSEIWCWGFGYSDKHGFALPYFAGTDSPVKMWSGRHVHSLEGGHRWMRAHVGFDGGGCGWIHWGQYGGDARNPIINRPERLG